MDVKLTEVEASLLAGTLGLYTPARDILVDWLVGADDGTETLAASSQHAGLPAEIGYINPNARSIVIQTDTSATYDYEVYFSRNIDTNADNVLVASATITAKSEVNIPLPASLGYDVYCILKVTPDVGQAAGQLEYKAYLIGRGG